MYLINIYIYVLVFCLSLCYTVFKQFNLFCKEVILMAFGKRIKLFRTMRGLKQRQVGEILGFNGAATEVRMAQYEAEAREPKAALVEQMASIFNVSPKAISVPEIDTYDGLMHTFFALEDMYGLKIAEIDGELCLHLDRTLNPDMNLLDLFELWHRQSMRLANGLITKQDYDEWRYNYPASQAALEQAAREKRRKDRSANGNE